jgi:alcohol dehydrogenase (cytochrome c)
MKSLVGQVSLALVVCCLSWGPRVSFAAESGLAGTWQTQITSPEATLTLTLVLNVDGPKLTGAISNCATWNAVPIYDSEVQGATASFKCRVGGSFGTPTSFTATLDGDQLLLTWDTQPPPYGWNRRLEKNREGCCGDPRDVLIPLLFGPSAPRRLTTKRVADASGELANLAARAPWVPAKTAAVTFDRILHGDRESHNWLTYSGNVLGHRHSPLTQVTTKNVQRLELAWTWQGRSQEKFEATPLVVDGVLYTVEPPSTVVALDASTGRPLWTYEHTPPATTFVCCGGVNRGLAILHDSLFVGTLDAKLLALNARTGKLIWSTAVADAEDPSCKGTICYSITHAPLIVGEKVIVGTAGGDTPPGRGIRGFIAAFNAATGKEVWRFTTIPAPGEPGHDTWSGDSWKYGGAAIWNTGSYDPDLNLTYWGTGNPSPDFADGAKHRAGDNLYSASVVALDADTGTLKWHYQFTPHDQWDWDSAAVPVLADIPWEGVLRKVMLFANRNGHMYVLDRTTGQFLRAKPFVSVNWLSGFDDKGRPAQVIPPRGTPVLPSRAATQWHPPSYSPRTGLFYIPAGAQADAGDTMDGPVLAFDPGTGERRWEFREPSSMKRNERPAGCVLPEYSPQRRISCLPGKGDTSTDWMRGRANVCGRPPSDAALCKPPL